MKTTIKVLAISAAIILSGCTTNQLYERGTAKNMPTMEEMGKKRCIAYPYTVPEDKKVFMPAGETNLDELGNHFTVDLNGFIVTSPVLDTLYNGTISGAKVIQDGENVFFGRTRDKGKLVYAVEVTHGKDVLGIIVQDCK